MSEDGEDEEVSLKPFRLVEPRVRQLVNTVVPRSLVALQQHQENIAKLLEQKEWDKVNTEQINAARTAQQLKDHLRTLEELRDQVVRSDIRQFDSRVEEIEQQLHQALLSYGILVSTSAADAVGRRSGCGGRQHVMSLDEESSSVDDTASFQFEVLPSTVADHSSTNTHTQESWEQLRVELDDLRDIMATLTAGVQSQHHKVAHVKEEVDTAAQEAQRGRTELARATRHNIKSYVLPVGGALVLGVVGALVGGPVGLVAGANIGAAAALTGVAAGGVSGGLLGRKIYRSTLPPEEIELKEVKKTD
jgi:septal ring factor EnvC (AmiA/AmiB activator)